MEKTIDFTSFINKYNIERNRLDKNASYEGYMYETYGEELEYVRTHYNKQIWTLLDDCETVLAGCHIVNRFGYFIGAIDNQNMELEFKLD